MKLSKTRTALGFGTGVCSVGAIITLLFANFGGEIRTSKQGLEIIGDAEGCRRDPYQCPADVLTVRIGSTAASGEKSIQNTDILIWKLPNVGRTIL